MADVAQQANEELGAVGALAEEVGGGPRVRDGVFGVVCRTLEIAGAGPRLGEPVEGRGRVDTDDATARG